MKNHHHFVATFCCISFSSAMCSRHGLQCRRLFFFVLFFYKRGTKLEPSSQAVKAAAVSTLQSLAVLALIKSKKRKRKKSAGSHNLI